MEVAIIIFILIIVMEYYESKQSSSKPISNIKKLLAELPSSFSSASEIDANSYTTEQFILFKHNYLQSQQWRDKRHLVIQRDGSCKLCKATTNLEVHHLSYKHLAQEPLDELITLCRTCHQSRHDILGIPQTLDEYLAFNDKLKELLQA